MTRFLSGTVFCGLLAGLILTTISPTFGQRQELSVSPIGFIQPKNQLIHYERHVNDWHSLTASLAYNGSTRGHELLIPYRTERFTNARAVIGYRYYFPGVGIGDDLTVFASARAVVDYSLLRLSPNSRLNIPTDSLRAAGISLAPELLFGGKVTLGNRVTLSGAIGAQYMVKLFQTSQLTQARPYWESSDSERGDWQKNRQQAVTFRQGWCPSFLITMGIILGKRPK